MQSYEQDSSRGVFSWPLLEVISFQFLIYSSIISFRIFTSFPTQKTYNVQICTLFFPLNRVFWRSLHSNVQRVFCSFSQMHHSPKMEGYFSCFQFLLLKTVPQSTVLYIHHFLCSLEQIPRNVISWSKWNAW